MSLEKLQNLSATIIQEAGSTFAATLTWGAVRTYDKIVVAWGVGDTDGAPTPSSADLPGDAKSYVIHGLGPDTSFVFKVEGGTRVDVVVTVDWQYSGFISTVVRTPSVSPFGTPAQLLFYSLSRPKVNNTFMASFDSGATPFNIATPVQVGGWEQDWTTLTPLHFQDDPRLLFYRQKDGHAFVAPLLANGPNLRVGDPTLVAGWENDWTQITSFEFLGTLHLLFYRQRDGQAYVATVAQNGASLTVGKPAFVGKWETDWTQIKALKFNGDTYIALYREKDPNGAGFGFLARIIVRNGAIDIDTPIHTALPANLHTVEPFTHSAQPYLLLYRNDGVPFAAHVVANGSGINISSVRQIANGWESDWAQIVFLHL